MSYLAAMLMKKVDGGIPAFVVRIPLEGRIFVGTTCPPGGEQDRLWDWIHQSDDLTDLVILAFELTGDHE